MFRTALGVAIGIAIGELLLAASGAYYGFEHGVVTSKTAPGPGAAAWEAFVFVAYFWWLALVGGTIGGLAGLGSWLVRPRRRYTQRGEN
jgi:hypothetical protein